MVYSQAGYYTTHTRNGDKVLMNGNDQFYHHVNNDIRVNSELVGEFQTEVPILHAYTSVNETELGFDSSLQAQSTKTEITTNCKQCIDLKHGNTLHTQVVKAGCTYILQIYLGL